MCLIGIAWQAHADYPLIVAANRDEFYARATQAAHWWPDASLLAGRDLVGGGTWLGVTRSGRVAALTNYREPQAGEPAAERPSRGSLVTAALSSAHPVGGLGPGTAARDAYAGFNLLTADLDEGRLGFVTNRGEDVSALPPGLYGMSNGELDAPWPKVEALKASLNEALAEPGDMTGTLLAALRQSEPAGDHALPDTGVGLEIERRLSAAFVHVEGYGTRSSTVLRLRRDGRAELIEQTFDARGGPGPQRRFLWCWHRGQST